MSSSVYHGHFDMVTGDDFQIENIDPPNRDGYCHEILGIRLDWRDDAEAEDCAFGVSVLGATRTGLEDKEIFDSDLIALAIGDPTSIQDTRLGSINLVDDAYFRDTVDLCLGERKGVNLAADVRVAYELTLAYKKITNDVRDSLERRCCGA